LDFLVRFGALAIGGIYVAGFIILTLHHAQYGIGEIDVFKARALSAGILFAILTAVPVMIASRIYGYFGFSSPNRVILRFTPPNAWVGDIVLRMGLYWACIFAANVTRTLFEDDSPNGASTTRWVVLAASFLGVILSFLLIRRHPRTAMVIELIAIPANWWAFYQISGQTLAFIGLWLFVGTQLTIWAQQFVTNPVKLRAFEWERWIGLTPVSSSFLLPSSTAMPNFGLAEEQPYPSDYM
jgi:hypothetical protein